MANPTGKGGFKKGQSGNPGGKAKKVREVEELCRAVLEQPDGRNIAIERLKEIVLNSDDEKAVITAANSLLDRAYGRPTQRKEVSGPEGKSLLGEWTDEQIESRARAILARMDQ